MMFKSMVAVIDGGFQQRQKVGWKVFYPMEAKEKMAGCLTECLSVCIIFKYISVHICVSKI